MRLRLSAATLIALGAFTTLVGAASPASAHAFLVRTEPGQGARLATSPAAVAIEFSESVPSENAEISLAKGVTGSGAPLPIQRKADGRVLAADLSGVGVGVYIANWTVVAEDGHISAGEFSFAVGVDGGTLPTARTTSGVPSPFAVAASWLVLAGFSAAAGFLLLDRLGAAWDSKRGLRASLGGAAFGAVAVWLASIGGPLRQSLVLAGVVSAISAALLAAGRRRRWPCWAALLASMLLWSARSQGAVANGFTGWLVDSVHLVAGAAWVGALGILAVALVRMGDKRGELLPLVKRYAQVALVLVVLLGLAGVASAWLLLTRPSDLWATGYGRLLSVKGGLFALALLGALVAKKRGLGRHNIELLRRSTSFEAAAVVLIVVVTAVVVNISPPPPRVAAAALLGPAPISGRVARDAGLAGILTVSLAATGDRLQVEVAAPGGAAPDGLEVTMSARLPSGRRVDLHPRPCGRGCLTLATDFPEGATAVAVRASSPEWPGGTFTATLDSPAPIEDSSLLRSVVETMRGQGAFKMTEQSSSGPDSVDDPGTFDLDGPQFVELEPYAAGEADDIRPLADGTPGLRLYLSGDRVWVTLWLDDRGRIAKERIVSVGHEILRTFQYSDA